MMPDGELAKSLTESKTKDVRLLDLPKRKLIALVVTGRLAALKRFQEMKTNQAPDELFLEQIDEIPEI